MTAMTVRQDTSRITADEFLSGVPGDPHPIGSELIDGVVHVNDATFRHQQICQRVNWLLLQWNGGPDGRGTVGWGGNWLLSHQQVYKPDVWWKEHPQPSGSWLLPARPWFPSSPRSASDWVRRCRPASSRYSGTSVPA